MKSTMATRFLKLSSALFFLVPAMAGPISSGIWYEFGFDPNNSPIVAGCPLPNGNVTCHAGVGVTNLDAPPWTFLAPGSTLLTVTDGLLQGDFFDVLDFVRSSVPRPARRPKPI